ncbi:exo-alpha-sialidase [Dyadobacter sp. LJ53]|uniref:exo-alpha-sialidase n=1 Tax=Dyadobacter chenwenxiniae TaxID=2906456 RepID=UPI001F163E5C|nr:exo-alpha-sialidase [Dyadobacter chenwenxiniae]MCF0051826.1 exo-alpha-sialidase [Dyadobacter chenwenxiniae]
MQDTKLKITTLVAVLCMQLSHAQDTIRYTGKTLVNVDYHHGALTPAIGAHSYQTLRVNRDDPGKDTAITWTYNHAPNLAYWNDTYYLNYLSNPVGEHIPPGQTLLQMSKDGRSWSKPVTLFPPYKIPDGTTKKTHSGTTRDLYAVMHQRMGFYVSKSKKLLTLAYYGIALDAKDDPNDGNGIGRVVREIKKDGSFGPIYFIRPNASWKQKSDYPLFSESKDKEFVKACEELLANKLVTQQWVEEADRDDPLISLKGEYKALSAYHLQDGRVVGLWKNALTSMSADNGATWLYKPKRAPGFVNSNAKIWGQKTSDGKYATVYNPSEFRWPLAVSVSDDGINYKNLLLVNGEITSMRYGGNYKSYGPQYPRGISEGDGTPPDGKLWVSYSMNKEDIWISSIPVPIRSVAEKHATDRFHELPEGKELSEWNIYSPLWAAVGIEKGQDGAKLLALKDSDPFDYAKAERVIPATKKLVAEISVEPKQNDHGLLDIELQDAKGTPGIRLSFDSTGNFRAKAGYRNKDLMTYKPGEKYEIKIQLNTETRLYSVTVNGRNLGNNILFAPLESVSRITFRTGDTRRFPNADTPTDQMYDLPNAGRKDREAVYHVRYLISKGN